MTEAQRKSAFGAVVADDTLGPRQIRVRASTETPDRAGDVMVAKGCVHKDYDLNPIFLADHNPTQPIGKAEVTVKAGAVEALVTFAPQGISAKADEYCGLYKAGILGAVSIGFKPLEYEPIDKKDPWGGQRYDKWELLEISAVAVPCNQEALVIERALKSVGDWKVGASRNLPIGGDEAWDGPAAEASIFDHAGFDGDKPDTGFARKGFLFYDASAPEKKGSYKEPFAKVAGGRLTAMPSGIRAAASRLPQTEGVSAEAREKARAVIDHYEEKMKPSDDDKAISAAIALLTKAGFAIDEKAGGEALRAGDREHRDAVLKCMKAIKACHETMLGLHAKAEALHDGMQESLQEVQGHMEKAFEHIRKLGAKKKPKPDADGSSADGYDDTGPDDADDAGGGGENDNELAYSARQREIEIARLAAAL